MNEQNILCFGDSNTWGYVPVSGERYARDVRWPGVMAAALGAGCHVIEEGLSGRTTVWDDPIEGDKNGARYLPACLASHQPLDLVILMLGTNDLKMRFSLSALDVAAGAERLLRNIQASASGRGGKSPAILLAAPPPIGASGTNGEPANDIDEMFQGGREKSLAFGNRFAALAQLCGCAFIDLGQYIAVDAADGIHYSAETHRVLGLAMAVAARGCLA